MDFGGPIRRVARKAYRCEACHEEIEAKTLHVNYKGQWQGEWQNWRMHEECHASLEPDDLEDGFIPGTFERPESVNV